MLITVTPKLAFFFFLEVNHLPRPRITLGIMPMTTGPSQFPYSKSLFHNNSYEAVYGLARS